MRWSLRWQPREALTSSRLTIVSVSDHELGRTRVEDAEVRLDGAVVTSTSWLTPNPAPLAANAAAR